MKAWRRMKGTLAALAVMATGAAALAETLVLSAPNMPDYCTAAHPYYDYTFTVPSTYNGFAVQPTGYYYAVDAGANSGNSARFFMEVEGDFIFNSTTFQVNGYGPVTFEYDVTDYISLGESQISVGVTRSAVLPGYDTVKIYSVQLSVVYTRGADVQAPSGSFSVQDDATKPDGRYTVISSAVSDNSGTVTGMRFSTDGTTWSAWEGYAATKAYLLPKLGSFTIYAQYRDAASNVLSATKAYTSSWSFLLPAVFTEGGGTQSAQIALPENALSNMVFRLVSSDPLVSVLEEVTLPAGTNTVEFAVNIGDDALLNGTRTGTVLCMHVAASSTLAGAFKLHDNETATLTVELPASVTENSGVLTNAGTVRVSQPVDADVTVALSSGDTTELTVPATVVIPAGTSSAAFNLTVPNDTLYDGTQSATVTASVTGWTSGSAMLGVLDDDKVLTLSLPSIVAEGWGICTNAGTVSIRYAAPSALTVALDAAPGGELSLPATVTIPAGATSAAFNFTPVDDAARDGAQTVTVTASAVGWTPAPRPLVVQDNEDGLFAFALTNVTSNGKC